MIDADEADEWSLVLRVLQLVHGNERKGGFLTVDMLARQLDIDWQRLEPMVMRAIDAGLIAVSDISKPHRLHPALLKRPRLAPAGAMRLGLWPNENAAQSLVRAIEALAATQVDDGNRRRLDALKEAVRQVPPNLIASALVELGKYQASAS